MLKKLTTQLIAQLQAEKLTIAFAESVTCGLASYTLSNVKGVSDVLLGAVVCYTPQVKIKLLEVSKVLIDKYTCESVQVTKAMTQNLGKLIPADMHIAITGLASPGGSETAEKPVGTIFIGIKYKNKTHLVTKLFKGSPLEIKKKACEEIYKQVLGILK